MLIQSSPTNGTFEWINPYKYQNPTITSITVLFRLNPVMFNNVDTTNVVTNTNDEERMISLITIHSVEDICIPMITRFDRLMFVFKDLVIRIIHLNGEFELLLIIDDRVEMDESEVCHNVE